MDEIKVGLLLEERFSNLWAETGADGSAEDQLKSMKIKLKVIYLQF
jgi:hypothetical protein